MCLTEKPPICEDCGEPLERECERDVGLCLNCQYDHAMNATTEEVPQ